MKPFRKKQLTTISFVYWFLLVYIIAALVWWFIELEKQNTMMTRYRLSELDTSSSQYQVKRQEAASEKKRKTAQYIMEGITFLALIILGAVYLYRSVRRQIRMQQEQQHFMMAITHELKTPIAVAQLNLETLQKHRLDEQKQQKLIQMTLQETNRLNHLTSNILVSSQLESGGYRLSKETLELSSLTRNCLSDFMRRFPERSWVSDIGDNIQVEGDGLLLQILINNLLENALKYSPRDTKITCRLFRKEYIQLEVTDEGPGIPDSERKNIFQKFYRLGNESTRTAKGTGLGLYLCSKIAEAHDADIQVHNNVGGGSTFIVIFSH